MAWMPVAMQIGLVAVLRLPDRAAKRRQKPNNSCYVENCNYQAV